MEFWKGHALGNDYIVVDGTGRAPPGPALVRALCDRHRGVGGDGVLLGDLDADPVGLRIFNPDGSEAEKSGNGLRIFGAWLHARAVVGDAPFAVSLPGEVVELRVVGRAADGALVLRVDMGRASFRAGDVGFTGADADAPVEGYRLPIDDGAFAIHLVSLGNPHCVVFVDPLDDDAFRRSAPRIQAHPAFARGVNVQFARVVDAATVEARILERGAGETLASGSSACAVAVAGRRARLTAPAVRVRMPGGDVAVEVDDDWGVRLTGEARLVFRGVVDEAALG